jgi:hypothetical protein
MRPNRARNNLVFCHADGRQYTRDDLNWHSAKVTRRAGLGRIEPA